MKFGFLVFLNILLFVFIAMNPLSVQASGTENSGAGSADGDRQEQKQDEEREARREERREQKKVKHQDDKGKSTESKQDKEQPQDSAKEGP